MALPAGTYSPCRISLRDKGGEVGTFSQFGKLVTEMTWADDVLEWTDFLSAFSGIVLGQIIEHEYAGVLTVVNPVALPASASAQRENKLLVRFYDATTFERFTVTIPTINLPILVFNTDAQDYVNMTTPAAVATFVGAFEDFIHAPRTGNLVVIESLEYVGRNT